MNRKAKDRNQDKKLSPIGWVIYILYNIVWLIGLPVLTLIVLIKSAIKPAYLDGYLRKLTLRMPPQYKDKSILIYGVSGGEMAIGVVLAKSIAEETDRQVILATHTKDGYDMAVKKAKDTTIRVEYLPYDFSPMIRRFVRRVKPELLLIIETEIWPSLVTVNAAKGIPVLMVNGRIYENDYPTYQRFRKLFKPTLDLYSMFLTQSEEDRQRLIRLGVSDELIRHTGNMKFDIRINTADEDKVNQIRQSINHYDNYTFAIIPSTHKGEEALIIDAYIKVKPQMTDLRLIIAPRHLNRIDELKALLKEKGISYTMFSDDGANDGEVLLIDTFGELMTLYPLAQLVIMGGSFSKAIGGHNILEPALFGKPIFIGKHYHNFRDIVNRFLKENAIKVIPDIGVDQTVSAIMDYKRHRENYEEMGRRGKAIIKSGQGVTHRITNMVLKWMNE